MEEGGRNLEDTFLHSGSVLSTFLLVAPHTHSLPSLRVHKKKENLLFKAPLTMRQKSKKN